eukprot:Pgem_evm1s11658
MKHGLIPHFESDPAVAAHNPLYALSSIEDNLDEFRNSNNNNNCNHCKVPFILVDDIEKLFSPYNDSVSKFCGKAQKCFHLFYGYQVRKMAQRSEYEKIFQQLKVWVKENKRDCPFIIIVVDWKEKWEAKYSEEKSTQNFKKGGLSWNGSLVKLFCYDEESDDVVVKEFSFHDIMNNNNNQDSFASAAAFELVLERVKCMYPHVEKVVLVSDNASNYSAAVALLYFVIVGYICGILVSTYFHFVEQDGKSTLDLTFGLIQTALERLLKHRNLASPAQLHVGIDLANVKNTFSGLFDINREWEKEVQNRLKLYIVKLNNSLKRSRFGLVEFTYPNLQSPSSENFFENLKQLSYSFKAYKYGKLGHPVVCNIDFSYLDCDVLPDQAFHMTFGEQIDLEEEEFDDLLEMAQEEDTGLVLEEEPTAGPTQIHEDNEDDDKDDDEDDDEDDIIETEGPSARLYKKSTREFAVFDGTKIATTHFTKAKLWNGKKVMRLSRQWKVSDKSNTSVKRKPVTFCTDSDQEDIISICLKYAHEITSSEDEQNVITTQYTDSGISLIKPLTRLQLYEYPDNFFRQGYAKRATSNSFGPPNTEEFIETIAEYTRRGVVNPGTKMSSYAMLDNLRILHPNRFDMPFDYHIALVVVRILRRMKNGNASNKKTGLPMFLEEILYNYLGKCIVDNDGIKNITMGDLLLTMFGLPKKKGDRKDKHITKEKFILESQIYKDIRAKLQDPIGSDKEEMDLLENLLKQM